MRATSDQVAVVGGRSSVGRCSRCPIFGIRPSESNYDLSLGGRRDNGRLSAAAAHLYVVHGVAAHIYRMPKAEHLQIL